VTAIGGTLPYQYSLDNIVFQLSNEFTVTSGSYTIYVKDANECTYIIPSYTIQNACITISKSGTFNDTNTDGNADVGETITYHFTVTNTGNVTLHGVTVTDPKVTVTGGPTTLDVGEADNTTFSGTYTLTQADIDAGDVDNTATADSDESGPASGSTTVPLPQAASLTISKSGTFNDTNTDGNADVGETITYHFTVTNTGNVTLHGVTVTDPKVTVTGGPTTLDVGEADNTTFSGTYTLTQADIDAGDVDNTATADSDESGPASGSTTVPLPQAASLTISKSGTFNDTNTDGNADVGETITYHFTVTNTGNVTLHGVTVTDPKVTVTGGPTTLDVGEADNTTFSGTYTLTQADIDAGDVDNTATADSDESGPASGSTTVPLPQQHH